MKKLNITKLNIIIIGVGGTGCHILRQIIHLPIQIKIIDRDVVEQTNLKRQIIYSRNDIGLPKVRCAKNNLKARSIVSALIEDLTNSNADSLLKDSNLIIECTDNISARLIINDYCRKNDIPWISTAAFGDIGQVLQIPSRDKSITLKSALKSKSFIPCYYCVVGERYGDSCNHADVNIKLLEKVALKVQSTLKSFIRSSRLSSEFIRISPTSVFQNIKIKVNQDCPVCHGEYLYLNGKKSRTTSALCGNDRYILDLKKTVDLFQLSKRIIGKKKVTNQALITSDFTILSSGKVIIKAESLKDARKKFDKEVGI
jgi:molybdopterin-synthase adenylyltransferase